MGEGRNVVETKCVDRAEKEREGKFLRSCQQQRMETENLHVFDYQMEFISVTF